MKLQHSDSETYGSFFPLTLKQARELCLRGNCNNPNSPLPARGYGRGIPVSKLADLVLSNGWDATKAAGARVQRVICGPTKTCWGLILYGIDGVKADELRAMEEPKLTAGDLIQDNHNRQCIVIGRVEQPGYAWRLGQIDTRVRELSDTEIWFQAFPLSGGAVDVPQSLCTVLRRANKRDFATAFKNGNGFAQDALQDLIATLKSGEVTK